MQLQVLDLTHKHFSCYLHPHHWFMLLLQINIYVYCRAYLAVSREISFLWCKQYKLNFGIWERNKKETRIKHELRVNLNWTWECFLMFWSRMYSRYVCWVRVKMRVVSTTCIYWQQSWKCEEGRNHGWGSHRSSDLDVLGNRTVEHTTTHTCHQFRCCLSEWRI